MALDIDNYIALLVRRHPAIESIWLIGSRANGTASPESDWDLILFSGDNLFYSLESDTEVHREDVDVFVVLSDGDSFARPWGSSKTGSLSAWQWTPDTDDMAYYIGKKWVSDNESTNLGSCLGEVVACRLLALRKWP